ncbi:hypothetical protein PLICRDRAFT_697339 [Plicaturopsis crispa FD-325 SS-3]|nr:hypothetical protein PLICRDRAFT_697339 [Plicaturopsis crispa FD-325 SS-3]
MQDSTNTKELLGSISPTRSDGSVSTINDLDDFGDFGGPLQRMAGPRDIVEIATPPSPSSSASSMTPDIDYEELIDELLSQRCSDDELPEIIVVEASSEYSNDTLMIKPLHQKSEELSILLYLNHEDFREDPWNPSPRILATVKRGEVVFVCIERLHEYNRPLFRTIANYTDFFRQCLEGLTFLHELKVTQLGYRNPYSLMMAIGTHTVEDFDRTLYPVRYCQVDYSHSFRLSPGSPSLPQDRQAKAFRRDIQDCGLMMDSLLEDVHIIAPKFKSLMKAMASGEFSADASRKLFEALCNSVESSVYATPINTPAVQALIGLLQ